MAKRTSSFSMSIDVTWPESHRDCKSTRRTRDVMQNTYYVVHGSLSSKSLLGRNLLESAFQVIEARRGYWSMRLDGEHALENLSVTRSTTSQCSR